MFKTYWNDCLSDYLFALRRTLFELTIFKQEFRAR